MNTSSESLKGLLHNLSIHCAESNTEAAISTAIELARLAGQIRAQDLLRTELAHTSNTMIFDVGANVGSASVKYRQMFPGATIHAFEPHPQAFAQLRQAFSNDSNVFVNNCGVGDRPGQLRFNMSSDIGSSSFLEISPTSPYIRGIGLSMVGAKEVEVTTIDSYCQSHGIGHIDFLKLDVQGFERKVLEGATGMLARHAIGAIQTEIVFRDFYKSSSSFFEIEQCLQAHGYTLRCIYDIYPAEGAQIFQCDAIYTYSPKPGSEQQTTDDPNQILSEALALQASGKLDEAQKIYLKLIESYPGNASLLAMAGAIDLQFGRNESARDLLRRALEIQPDNQDVAFRLGLSYFSLGEEDMAIRHFHGLANNPTAQLLLSQLYTDAGDHGAAVIALLKAKQAGADVDAPLALALLNSGDKQGAEIMLRQLVHPGRQCDRWLAMALGKLLIDQGRSNETRQYFADLATSRPELVDVAPTVLADADLAEGNPARAFETIRPVMHSNWSRTFVSASLAQLSLMLDKFGIDAKRRPHPFPNSSTGVTMTSLESFGRFAHQLQEYLFMRWQADATGAVLETPDWVGQLVFELDDPYPTGPRRQVKRSSAWIEEEVAKRGAQALAGFDFFSPGTFSQWQPAHVELARKIFKLRPCWLKMLEPPLAALRGSHQTLVVLHLRRTDQSGRFQLPDNRWYLDWLRQTWPKLSDPVLYIASDDLDAVLGDFAEFSPRCVNDLPGRVAGLEWLHDFHAIMNADAVAISQSAFSYFACMLNTRCSVFKQPDMMGKCLIDYLPEHNNLAPTVAT